MKTQNANIDFCGVVNLLQYLVEHGHCTKKEAQKISERVAEKLGADIILNTYRWWSTSWTGSAAPFWTSPP